MPTLKVEVVTPDAKILETDADIVQIPAADGDMGIYPQHETTVTELKAGELVITRKVKLKSWPSAKALRKSGPTASRSSPTARSTKRTLTRKRPRWP